MANTWAYDLDGVLADAQPDLPNELQQKWGRLNGAQRAARNDLMLWAYDRAPPLYQPPQHKFHVITARRDTPAIRAVTEQWLHHHFRGRVKSLSLLAQPRRIDVVVPYKARALVACGATDFLEDNIKVVRGVAAALPALRVWLYQHGQLESGPPYKKRPAP